MGRCWDRMVLAGVFSVVLAACTATTSNSPGEVAEAVETTTTTIVGGEELALVADGGRGPDGRAIVSGQSLRLDVPSRPVILAFDRSTLSRDCISSARLTVTRLVGDALVTAWVSVEDGFTSIVDGDSLGGTVIARGSPSVSADADDRYAWDVTELVDWGLGRQTDGESLALALALRTGSAGARVELGSLEGGQPARLVVAQRPGCGG